MAIEQITPEQQQNSNQSLKECQDGLSQQMQQAAEDAAKKLADDVKKISQQLAQVPVEILEQLEKAKDKLCKIINGYENPELPEFDPAKILIEIEKMLKPVIDGLKKLPVPSIPGLADISELLKKLMAMASNLSGLSKIELNKLVPKRPQTPNKILDCISELINAIQTLMTALPLVLINVIFQMINVIISLFQQIAGVIGVPGIPYPLSLVPDCIELVPKIFDLMLNASTKISCMTKGIVRKKLQEIQALQIPSPPDNIKSPSVKPPCPKR